VPDLADILEAQNGCHHSCPKSPLAPLFQRGETKTGVLSSGGLEKFFSRISIFAPSPFDKGGSRGIFHGRKHKIMRGPDFKQPKV
jgi:hypothetical protein